MKSLNALCLCLSLVSPLLLSQCASSTPQTVSGSNVALSTPTGKGTVTTQRIGDTTVETRTLINRPLTNADGGKTYQIITVSSPRGVSRQERVIVQATPHLETRNVTTKIR